MMAPDSESASSDVSVLVLTLLRRRSLSYRIQSIDLQCKLNHYIIETYVMKKLNSWKNTFKKKKFPSLSILAAFINIRDLFKRVEKRKQQKLN